MSLANLKLYALVFIDSLCCAFLPPIMAAHVFKFGGNHTILGILASIHAACQMISSPIIRSCSSLTSEKSSLLLSLLVYLVTYYGIGITTSCLIFVILRACFALTNQTQSLCRSIATKTNDAEVTESVNNFINIAGVSGLIIGPVISSLIFDYFSFYCVTLVASSLLVLSFCISLTLPVLPNTPKDTKSIKQEVKHNVISAYKTLRTIKYKKYYFLILLKTFYVASLTIFFIKFSFALKLNQGLSFTTIGLTYAYQSSITFLSTFTVNYYRPTLNTKALLRWLYVLAVSLYILSNTSLYVVYLGSFITMAVAHGVLSRLFRELFSHYKMSDAEDSLNKVISVIIPGVFGIACDRYGLTAFNAFVVLPIFCDIFIVYASTIIIVNDNIKEDDETEAENCDESNKKNE